MRYLSKYAEGDLRYDSFHFRGPDNRHNLRAQNLTVFCQFAEDIDEQTWIFHLKRSDYSHWSRKSIKDGYLADETRRIERSTDLTPPQTRQLIQKLVGALHLARISNQEMYQDCK